MYIGFGLGKQAGMPRTFPLVSNLDLLISVYVALQVPSVPTPFIEALERLSPVDL